MKLIGTRPKSKNNPKGICKVCGDKIFNRARHALVCIECEKIVWWLRMRLERTKNRLKINFPDYKLTIKYKIQKKK